MGRLIDRNVLLEFVKEELKQDRPYDLKIRNIQRFIEDMPTAYDIEKVVAELEREKAEWCSAKCLYIFRKAIEIVRKGGVK